MPGFFGLPTVGTFCLVVVVIFVMDPVRRFQNRKNV